MQSAPHRQKGRIDLTVDHHLQTRDGRKQIREDIKRTELLVESIVDVVTQESVQLQDAKDHIGDVQKELDVQKALALHNGGEHAKTLNQLDTATPEQKQAALNAYAQVYADTFGIDIDSAKLIAVKRYGDKGVISGVHYSADGTSSQLLINDIEQHNARDFANTLGHEVAEAQIQQDTIRDRDGRDRHLKILTHARSVFQCLSHDLLCCGVGAQGGSYHDVINSGGSYAIIGRAIYNAQDPAQVVGAIINSKPSSGEMYKAGIEY